MVGRKNEQTAKNKEKRAAQRARYYSKNREKILARMATCYAENKEKTSTYYSKNKEKQLRQQAIYRKYKIALDALLLLDTTKII
jgi:hypothetical protein